LDKISQTGAECHVDCGDMVKIETRCRITIWQTFGRIPWNVIPEPPATLQGAATWRIQCHDPTATCHTDLPTLVNCQAGHTAPFPCPFPYPSLQRVPVFLPHLLFPSPTRQLSLPLCIIPFLLIFILPILPYLHPLNPARESGERCKLPQRVRAEPGRQMHLAATEAQIRQHGAGL